jgi:hypothetical protein
MSTFASSAAATTTTTTTSTSATSPIGNFKKLEDVLKTQSDVALGELLDDLRDSVALRPFCYIGVTETKKECDEFENRIMAFIATLNRLSDEAWTAIHGSKRKQGVSPFFRATYAEDPEKITIFGFWATCDCLALETFMPDQQHILHTLKKSGDLGENVSSPASRKPPAKPKARQQQQNAKTAADNSTNATGSRKSKK